MDITVRNGWERFRTVANIPANSRTFSGSKKLLPLAQVFNL